MSSDLATMSPADWLGLQTRRHGVVRYVPYKRSIFQEQWAIMDVKTKKMVTRDNLTLLKARVRANTLNKHHALGMDDGA